MDVGPLHPISPDGYDAIRRNLLSDDPAPESERPALRVGKYRIIRQVGEGGMATVYEADDPDLHRRVALKVLRSDAVDSRLIQRFHREAAIAAQLRHPGIVRIHEVAMATDAAGAPVYFIAMDFVEGRTLHDVFAEGRPRRELLTMLEAAADAIAYAHEQGVVHRDLKPGNVLIDGQGRVALADFGLARAVSFATPLTRSHTVMGTAGYMAPEQVEGKGRDVDERADVYALGVMLYQALTGRLPFSADSLASLYRKTVLEEAVPPTRLDRSIDRDVELICLKALEKDPARRYPTGRAFQQDLRRWLEEKPVEARPPSVLYRLRKGIHRHRGAVAVGAAAFAVLGAVAIPLALEARRARTESLQLMREVAESALAAALSERRNGNWEGMRQYAEKTEAACRKAMEQWPDLAEAHLLLGRMRRAMMDEEGALACQEQALRLNPSLAGARYERIVLDARRWRRTVQAAAERLVREEAGGGTSPLRELAARDPEAAALRARISRDLGILLDEAGAAPLDATSILCARALQALTARDHDRTRDLLREAVASGRYLEEAHEVLGHLEARTGDADAAVRRWTEALEADKGCLPFLEGRADACISLAYRSELTGESPRPHIERAMADIYRALEGARKLGLPERECDLLLKRGSLHGCSATFRVARKEDAGPDFRLAFRDLDEVVRRRPDSADARVSRAFMRMLGAQTARDPTPDYEMGLEDAVEATRLQRDSGRAWMMRGTLKSALARLRRDSGAIHREAVDDLEQARGFRSDHFDVWRELGRARWEWGLAMQGRGDDGLPLLQQAARDFGEALDRAPGRMDLLRLRADLRRLIGGMIAGRGGDPRPAWTEALADFTEALKRREREAPLWSGRSLVHLSLAEYEEDARRDPTEAYEAGIRDMDRSLQLNPGVGNSWLRRGTLRLRLAGWRLLNRGQDVRELLAGAASDFGEALRKRADGAGAWKGRGRAEFLMGKALASRGGDPGERYRAALEAWTEAIRLDAGLEPGLRAFIEECRRTLGER